jgi:hypothetical protein
MSLAASSVALAQHQEPLAQRPAVEKVAKTIGDELARLCPVAQPNDTAAYYACRKALFEDSQFKQSLAPIVLWGRPGAEGVTLKDTNLTQFAPDVLSGMYVPLFMFNGKHTITFDSKEGLYRVAMEAGFRNRMSPSQFPYPFWHDDNKWSTYQGANQITFWVDPKTVKVRVGQFTNKGPNAPIVAIDPVARPKFDGKWQWTDDKGVTQPVVTMFDGLYSAKNPNLPKLDVAYKDLALKLREGQCDSCHVPNNPDKMKRLVLLQTPAHAAAEIQRLVKAVRDDKMPLDDFGIEKELPHGVKKDLLQSAEKFEATLEAVKLWEKQFSVTEASALKK